MEQDTLELALIRHGESYNNLDGSGGLDSELTDVGIAQAERLAPWLAANFRFSAIYSSPLRRARRTAEIATVDLHKPIVCKDNLSEVEFELRGILPRYTDPVAALVTPSCLVEQMPSPYAAFADRVTGAFVEILRLEPRGTVAVFTHGGVIATLLRIIFGAHQVSVYADNTSVTLLRWQNLRWYLVFSNRREHLL